jgi:hypothetical protein
MVVIFTVVMAKVGIPQMKEQKNSANIVVRLRISALHVAEDFIVAMNLLGRISDSAAK